MKGKNEGEQHTPFVVRGSERGIEEWNSPWLETASGLRFADIVDSRFRSDYLTTEKIEDWI